MYRNILCLIPIHHEAQHLVQQAQALASTHSAKLSLLHVVEYIPLAGAEEAILATQASVGDELELRARQEMQKLATAHQIADERCTVVSGSLISELETRVAEQGYDLVVIGNHNRKGLSAIFDHAEDAVLHRCPCDLLAINLPE